MLVHALRRAYSSIVVVVCGLALCPALLAQGAVQVTGRVIDSVTGGPVADAVVALEELKQETESGADGAFVFDNVPPGRYHLTVRGPAHVQRRIEVAVAQGVAPLDALVDPELHFEEVLSVSPDARSQFESFQPTSVLAGQELTKQLEMSLGATLREPAGRRRRAASGRRRRVRSFAASTATAC